MDEGGLSVSGIGRGPGCGKTTYPPMEPGPSSFRLGWRPTTTTQLRESTMKTVSCPDPFFVPVSPPYE